MKLTKLTFSIVMGSVAMMAAIERPGGGDTKVPAEPKGGILDKSQKGLAPDNGGAEAEAAKKIAYLGVRGEGISEALKMHLEIEDGLLLSTVDPTSPAGLSGLKENDIILSFGDDVLSDQDSLRDAVMKREPGDAVALKLVRRGKQIEQEVTLGVAPLAPNIPPMALVPNQAADLSKLLNQRLGLQLGGLGNGEMEKEMMEQLQKAFGGRADAMRQLKFEFPGGMRNQLEGGISFGSVSLRDNDGSVEMKTKEGKRTVIVRDKEGEILFEGPYNTDEEKVAVPENLRQRVERLDGKGNGGLRLQFGGFQRKAPEEKGE